MVYIDGRVTAEVIGDVVNEEYTMEIERKVYNVTDPVGR